MAARRDGRGTAVGGLMLVVSASPVLGAAPGAGRGAWRASVRRSWADGSSGLSGGRRLGFVAWERKEERLLVAVNREVRLRTCGLCISLVTWAGRMGLCSILHVGFYY